MFRISPHRHIQELGDRDDVSHRSRFLFVIGGAVFLIVIVFVLSRVYVPLNFTQTGIASWYGPGFEGKPTASGEPFDTGQFTAAHRKLSLGSIVRVTNLGDGASVIVRVNDRGPYVAGRVIDLSRAAAEAIGLTSEKGIARVRIDGIRKPYLSLGCSLPSTTRTDAD